MTVNAAVTLQTNARVASIMELLGSMRFAISALSIVSIASIIGTLLRQREPLVNYVNQFGPFWAELFRAAGIYEVYNAWWFILVMAFLVASTSVCVLRNAPKFVREMRSFQTAVRLSSLRAMPNRGEVLATVLPEGLLTQANATLLAKGYKVKQEVKEGGTLIAAKAGAVNRLGYVFAHLGIVVVCIAGLADSEIPLRTAIAWLDKKPMPASTTVDQVKPEYRLPVGNPSYRANLFVVEGQKNDMGLLSTGTGTYLQDLPFTLELKKFRVEYYSTGMPKLFASDVVVTDKQSGAKREATIKVNEPLIEQGVAVYQSSFDDGGSKVKLRAYPLDGSHGGFTLDGEVGGSIPLKQAQSEKQVTLEVIGLRPINVENMQQAGLADAELGKQAKFKESVASVLSPAGNSKSRDLKNVGPSVQYKLRDQAGQAREFNVYMVPVELEGSRVILAGMRDAPNEQFRFLRVPVDDKDSLDEFFRLRSALNDEKARKEAAMSFARRAAPKTTSSPDSQVQEQLSASAQRALDTFAKGGLQEVASTLEKSVPKAEQEKAAEVYIRVLSGALWDLWQGARRADKLPEAPSNEQSGRFLQMAQNALSDTFLVGSPLLFQLSEFEHIQASVFQVTKSPGKKFVYLGSLMLVLGVFAMFYIRERRIWCWVQSDGEGSRLVYAMNAPRKTLQTEQDFTSIKEQLDSLGAKA